MANSSPSRPISAILIDDEPLARTIVREYLQSYPMIEILQECNDGFEGLKAIQQLHPDLVFLDIQMPKINGFEMLELVEEAPAVIFTTAFDEFAIRAFEANAVDYLLKPFSKERFDKALRKWLEQHADHQAASTAAAAAGAANAADTAGTAAGAAAPGASRTTTPAASGSATHAASGSATPVASGSGTPADDQGSGPAVSRQQSLLDTAAESPAQTQRVVVKTAGKIKIIPIEDIHYLEAADDYVKVHTHNGAFLKNRTMGYFEKVLDPDRFVRTHRSYIINIQQVTRIDPYEKDSHLCILSSGAQVPVSKAGYVKLRAVLGL